PLLPRALPDKLQFTGIPARGINRAAQIQLVLGPFPGHLAQISEGRLHGARVHLQVVPIVFELPAFRYLHRALYATPVLAHAPSGGVESARPQGGPPANSRGAIASFVGLETLRAQWLHEVGLHSQ